MPLTLALAPPAHCLVGKGPAQRGPQVAARIRDDDRIFGIVLRPVVSAEEEQNVYGHACASYTRHI